MALRWLLSGKLNFVHIFSVTVNSVFRTIGENRNLTRWQRLSLVNVSKSIFFWLIKHCLVDSTHKHDEWVLQQASALSEKFWMTNLLSDMIARSSSTKNYRSGFSVILIQIMTTDIFQWLLAPFHFHKFQQKVSQYVRFYILRKSVSKTVYKRSCQVAVYKFSSVNAKISEDLPSFNKNLRETSKILYMLLSLIFNIRMPWHHYRSHAYIQSWLFYQKVQLLYQCLESHYPTF